ncbi:hypothetical protein TNCV_1280581, partial [Trichonephila clavipes]
TRGLFGDGPHVILNHGQVTWTTPELAPPPPNYHTTPPHQREDVSALDRLRVTCTYTAVFGGNGLGTPDKAKPRSGYPYQSATAAAYDKREIKA